MNPHTPARSIAISIRDLGKCFHIYDRPSDRLRQFFFPRLRRLAKRGVRAYFREFWALRGVSFDVMRGESFGILGRNGAGKSTLLQLICGTLTPTTGQAQVHGRVAALLELGAGFNPDFTGSENIHLNASVLGLDQGQIEARLPQIVEFAGIGDFIDQPVKTYSSGMFVRLAFAIAIHVDPDILIVDEALSVGDIAFQNKCIQKIRELKAGGTTLLFVSHDLSTLQLVCDRAVWLQDGKVIQIGDPVAVCQDYYAMMLADAPISVPVQAKALPQQQTGLAQFTRLYTTDGNALESKLFQVGQELQIHFELEAMSPLFECIFTVSIYRSDGDWSIGQTSAEGQVVWPALPTGQRHNGTLSLTPLSLTPAEYMICLSAFSSDLQTCYAMTDLTTEFSVRCDYQTWGKFIHPCEWRIDIINGAEHNTPPAREASHV